MTTGVREREATWRSMPGDFLHDQKDLWTFPIRLAKGHYLMPTAIVIGGTIGLIYADPHDMPYFRNHQRNWDDVKAGDFGDHEGTVAVFFEFSRSA